LLRNDATNTEDHTVIDLETYLETEFRRYFPDMTDCVVGAGNDDELIVNITISVETPASLDFYQTNAGESDDDWFIFESDLTGRPITVPFPAANTVEGF
jgi:hypothetical protein